MDLKEKMQNLSLKMADILNEWGGKENIKLDFVDTLEDGTPVQFSPDLVGGATAMLTNEDGTMPLADGEYTLAEANKTVTIYEGKVSNIQEKKEAVSELAAVLEAKLSAQFVSLAKVTELETKIAEQNETITKLSGVVSEAIEAISNFSAPAPTREVTQKSASGLNPESIIAALAEIKKNKNKLNNK